MCMHHHVYNRKRETIEKHMSRVCETQSDVDMETHSTVVLFIYIYIWTSDLFDIDDTKKHDRIDVQKDGIASIHLRR